MKRLSVDPFEGARCAFFAINKDATDEDWESWTGKRIQGSDRNFDNNQDYASLCRQALTKVSDLSGEQRELIAYALGYFEANDRAVKALHSAQIASSHVFQHHARYRQQLLPLDANAQFD